VVNGGDTIVRNVGVIRSAVEPAIAGDVELIVVSDGSVDDTAEQLLKTRETTRARVIHYDRNLGKGYAIRAGSLAARGEWIAFIDADLDLDPHSIPAFLEIARRERLHFAIGSKRHPQSVVHYPRSRRVASWCYQTLNRLLFRLDVRDTQVGLKVFHREIAERVMPLLLVKQFAFDLELLAVSRALGYTRVRELPIRLDYRFTGSGVRSAAFAMALVDTAAIFYRLRILRTYQRKRVLLGLDLTRPAERRLPAVGLVGGTDEIMERLDYTHIEVLDGSAGDAARDTSVEIIAIMPPGARPAGNWLSAAVAFFTRPSVAAVVVPALAPPNGSMRRQAASAMLESRFGAGSRRIRFSPGNLRTVVDFPAESIVIRRSDLLAALADGVDADRLVAWLAARGREVVYTPEAMMVVPPPSIFVPHVRSVAHYARSRGVAARQTRGRSLTFTRFVTLLPFALGVAAIPLLVAGATTRSLGLAFLALYAATLSVVGLTGALRFRSFKVGMLVLPALAATHVVYVGGFLAGVARGR
jgi:glycosyltransferase involved in cell wall biosynthesis